MPARVTVRVRLHDVQIERLFSGKIRREVLKVVREGLRLSEASTPRHSRELLRSLGCDVDRVAPPDGYLRGWWGTRYPVRHAMWVHDGTGIYGPRRRPIVPRRGKYLVFRPYRLIGPVKGGKRGVIPKKYRPRRIAVTSVRGQPRTPFLTEPFKVVMAAHGIPFHVRRDALRSLPSNAGVRGGGYYS